MSDLPAQGKFQQLSARPTSGEHLEVMGKKASANWHSGASSSLSAAVVEIVKHAGLSPEQVKRVIEFANTDAYLTEFKKEGDHKVIDFGSQGPADPSEILKDLNDGGGGSVFDPGTSDYRQPPRGTKLSSSYEEQGLLELFKVSKGGYPEENPYKDVEDLRHKLAAVTDNLTAEISGLEVAYGDLSDRLYQGVKQASLSGRSLGEVVQLWHMAVPSSGHVKVAFELLAPRLLREGVFSSYDTLEASITKTGSVRTVNPNHPMVEDFREYCDVLSKLAEMRAAQKEVRGGLQELTTFLKEARPNGLFGHAAHLAERASHPVGRGAHKLVEAVTGEHELGEMAGGAARAGVKYSPHVAGLIALNEGHRAVVNSDAYRKLKRVVPGNSDYDQRTMELQQGGQQQYGF